MSEQQQEQQTPESPTERPPSHPDQHQEGAPEADPTTPGVKSPPNEQDGSDNEEDCYRGGDGTLQYRPAQRHVRRSS